jgi:formylglycine-generating enzyme required for sulfatase activity
MRARVLSTVAVGIVLLYPLGPRAQEREPLDAGRSAQQRFEFDVVTVDATGEETTWCRESAQLFVEVLPGGVPLELVAVPAGRFRMGTSAADLPYVELELRRVGLSDDDATAEAETPLHEVRVGGFLVGRFEVTQAQWRAVASLPKVLRDLDPTPSEHLGDTLPVEDVSWRDAVEFCARLSAHTGRTYRLPSEAEWEYACRAGTTTHFHFGDALRAELANYWGEQPFGAGPANGVAEEPVPVGSFGVANAFGLSDMHGNVAEWCQDVWHRSYAGAPADGSAWLAPGDDGRRVVRGGSYYSYGVDCRSAARLRMREHDSDDDVGLRVVLDGSGRDRPAMDNAPSRPRPAGRSTRSPTRPNGV